jgi:hypothetical protein
MSSKNITFYFLFDQIFCEASAVDSSTAIEQDSR